MNNINIGTKTENGGRNSGGILYAEEFNEITNKVKELVDCVNENKLETIKREIETLNKRVADCGGSIASFDVIDGCLVMTKVGNNNLDFSINESGNLILDVYGTN